MTTKWPFDEGPIRALPRRVRRRPAVRELRDEDGLDQASLRRFVDAGGCVYASDLTSGLIDLAFPGKFRFSGRGRAGPALAHPGMAAPPEPRTPATITSAVVR